ncbi:hypothetical protein Acsp01_16740 [Actinoplanes sp. NBRC 101535]|nr:hypothetical protein Acsp01_16740 [Actinoplanes sp. NBRC 101535]
MFGVVAVRTGAGSPSGAAMAVPLPVFDVHAVVASSRATAVTVPRARRWRENMWRGCSVRG